ncbi:MAG: hypothetical protein K6G12_00845 [Lachnospiraceae bacterium]|nr:hypothetical protein [Lachnospiraceae bacterium]
MNRMSTDYSDIIDLPRHVSGKHPQMSVHDRAAQFAPFAALTGYGDMIDDAGEKNALASDSVIFTADELDIP